MITKRLLVLGCVCLTLSACATVKERSSGLLKKDDTQYTQAQTNQGLKVPPGLSAMNVGEDYPIPPVSSNGPVPVSVVPPGGVSKTSPPGYVPPTNQKQASKKQFLKPIM